MRDIQINGVGFNVDAVLKMTKQEFLNWNFFTECWTHLKADKKKEVIEEAWRVINELMKVKESKIGVYTRPTGNYTTELNIGNANTNIKQPELLKREPATNSGRKRDRDQGKLSKPASGTSGNGTQQGPDADNA